MKKIKYFPEFDVDYDYDESSVLLTTYTHRLYNNDWYDIIHRYKYIKNHNQSTCIDDLKMAERFITQVKNTLDIPLTIKSISTMGLKPYIKPYDRD